MLPSQKNNMRKIILLTLLLLGPICLVGCGSNETTTESNSGTTVVTQPPVVKQLPASKNQNPAYDYCEARDYELIIRFDKASQGSKAYCRFPDTTECYTLDFMQGNCGPGQGSELYNPSADYNKYENCSQTYEPVCTKNGITFTNQCIAQKQKAVVIHTGPCLKEETSTDYSETSKKTTSEESSSEISLPDWLPILSDLITSEPVSDPPAFVEKCIYGSNIVYYQSSGCTDCYSTLYNTEGEVICFPNNDTTGSCPSYFDQNDRGYYCDKIWTDTR